MEEIAKDEIIRKKLKELILKYFSRKNWFNKSKCMAIVKSLNFKKNNNLNTEGLKA